MNTITKRIEIKKETSILDNLLTFHIILTTIKNGYFVQPVTKTLVTFDIANTTDRASAAKRLSALDKKIIKPLTPIALFNVYGDKMELHPTRQESWGNVYQTKYVTLENDGFSTLLADGLIHRGKFIKGVTWHDVNKSLLGIDINSRSRIISSTVDKSVIANFR